MQVFTYTLFLPMLLSFQSWKGVGMPIDHQQCRDVVALAARWSYDWSARPACGGVPMIWGRDVPTVLGDGEYTLVFNEPNNPAQANLAPAEAATIAEEIGRRFPNKKLIIGGTYDGYGGLPTGEAWLREFLAVYRGRIDGIHWHCYQWTAEACIADGDAFVRLARAHGLRELWVTEFAFVVGYHQRPQEEAWVEAEQYLAWLKTHVNRYAWFAARIYGEEWWTPPGGWYAPLIDRAGQKTFWGQHYEKE